MYCIKCANSLHSCSPEERASALSVLSFSWLDGLIATGVRRILRRDDVPSPSKAMKVVNITESYEEAADRRRKTDQVWKTSNHVLYKLRLTCVQ